MLNVIVFIALLFIPVRFFYVNRYFFTLSLGDAFSQYKTKESSTKNIDSILAVLFIIGMGALAAV